MNAGWLPVQHTEKHLGPKKLTAKGMQQKPRRNAAGRQAGISASFFVELRTTCLEKRAAHSGLHPPVSVNYQDTPPQTDLRSSLVEAK